MTGINILRVLRDYSVHCQSYPDQNERSPRNQSVSDCFLRALYKQMTCKRVLRGTVRIGIEIFRFNKQNPLIGTIVFT